MRAFLTHSSSTHSPRRQRSVQHFTIGWIGIEHPFGWGSSRIIIDVFWSGELATHSLEHRSEMRLSDAGSEGHWIAEKETFVLMHLEIWHQSNVGPQIRNLGANICFDGLFNSDRLVDIRQVRR